MGIENPVHLAFVAVVALVVLGPRRLPELAKAVGRGVREFREAISGESDHAPVSGPGAEHAAAVAPQPEPRSEQVVALRREDGAAGG